MTNTSKEYEFTSSGRFLKIDKEGYGHLTYTWMSGDNSGDPCVYYAKSKEPVAEPQAIVETSSLTSSPSLCISGTQVRFSLPQSSFVRLVLYDASGRMVQELARGCYPAGQSEIAINRYNLSRGVYFVRLQSDNSSASARLVLIR